MKKLLVFICVLFLSLQCYALEVERQKNVATVIIFPLWDSTTTTALQSSATALDSEIDQFSDSADNPDGFADCTNEATEIGTTGQYYLILTQAEMNEDYIIVQIKASDAITQTILIRTTIGDPLNYATTDDGGTINVTGGAIDTVSAAILADTDHVINSLTIDDDTGDAFTIITRGGNGNAVVVTGNGTGAAMLLTGGDTGHGLSIRGGTSGGQGINALARGGNGAGVLFQGVGTGEGLDARGGTTGHGISGLGGASGGAGIYGKAQANNDAGMELVKHGTGDDFDADTIADDTVAILIDTAAYDTDAEYATAIWNALTNAYGGVGTYGQAIEDGAGGITAQQVWEFNISAINTAGYAGTVLNAAGGSAFTLSAIAEAVWTLFDRRMITGGGGRY